MKVIGPAMSDKSKSTQDTVSRTIRFKPADLELIDAFLDQNPIFDFSSLTRTAVLGFIKNPQIEIRAVQSVRQGRTRNLGGKE